MWIIAFQADRRHREHEAHLALMDTLVLRLTDNDGTLAFKHNALSQAVAKTLTPPPTTPPTTPPTKTRWWRR